ncbi:MAG TPA: post-COAP-1 domain-containing protein [Vicinamibacterales bacterium]|nr:post-COAP-1 domain-containing protein [Vicinamibacterales bacterium]
MSYRSVVPTLAVVISLATVPVAAEASHTTLTGEVLQGTVTSVQRQSCAANNQPPHFVFTVEGVAAGPYPGTFVEKVDWNWGRNPAFISTFVIQSVDADGAPITITGEKRGFLSGSCFIVPDPAPVNGTGTVTYTANINGQTDTGVSQVSFTIDASRRGVFNETFTSTLQPAVVILSPSTDVNPVGTPHTVTATAFRGGRPAAGVTVEFTVTGSVDETGFCTTDATGSCTFTYNGPDFPGVDTITGCPEDDLAGPGSCGRATKVWVLPASTPGQVTGGGGILHGLTIDGVRFGFNAQLGDDGLTPKGRGNVIDHTADIHIKLLDVTTLVVAGTHATFFGNADFNGTHVQYRVDVDDLGEGQDSRVFLPGSENNRGVSLDTFKIQTDHGYVAFGPLTQGNIQIHR